MTGLPRPIRVDGCGIAGTRRSVARAWTTLACLFWALCAAAQEGLRPPVPLAQDLRPLGAVEMFEAPGVDVAALLEEDEQRESRNVPFRFASPFVVSVTPADNGLWEESGDGRMSVWRMRVTAAGAVSMSLGFERYAMPPGGRLLVYTPDYAEVVGPFTDADNESHGQLWTPVLRGDEVVIEVAVPVDRVEDLSLELGSVNRGYRDFGSSDKQSDCNVSIACSEADGHRDVARSVGRIQIGGSGLCSGALLNNTSEDGRPYLLTAAHCGIDGSNAATIVVYWNYEGPVCGPLSGGSLSQSQTGAYFRAGHRATDFTLLELDDPPAPAHDVYWSGWDRSAADPDRVAGVHHPRGSEKAISLRHRPTTTSGYGRRAPNDGSHIRVSGWDSGTTEGGSSGSPLFDRDKRIVGQLHGGEAGCRNEVTDWYGRLSMSWDGGGTQGTRLRDWLDPAGTGAMALNGRDSTGASPGPLATGGLVLDLGEFDVDGRWLAVGLGTVTVSVLLLSLARARRSIARGLKRMSRPVAHAAGGPRRGADGNIVWDDGLPDPVPDPQPSPRPGGQCFVVGRDPECDVRLQDDTVSWRHAEVERLSGGRLHLTDCRSTNGTFVLVDDVWRPIRQQVVHPMQRIRFGACGLTGAELDALCARVRAEERGSDSSSSEDARGVGRGPVRNWKTGEIVDR